MSQTGKQADVIVCGQMYPWEVITMMRRVTNFI